MDFVLGIDAGATKTKAAIADENGKILGRGKSGPGNIKMHSAESFQNIIKDVIKQATGEETYRFSYAVLGVAGSDTEESIEYTKKLAEDILNAEKIKVVNDTLLVRPACSDKNYGVTAVVGTGSNFYGVNRQGREVWVGGLDWKLSDEGSAYWIGEKTLKAVVRAGDGRGEKTALEELVYDKYNITSHRDLVKIVYEESFNKTETASLAVLVDNAYEKGDKVATSILEEATDEIALSINTIIDRLEIKDEDFDIVAIGGEFRSPYNFAEKIQNRIRADNAEFKVCKKELTEGAVKLALGMI